MRVEATRYEREYTLALCNEVVRELSFAEQCRLAAELGYDALEVAPFTLVRDPRDATESMIAGWRADAAAAGLRVSSLHWLLTSPDGLSITAADQAVRRDTLEVIDALVRMCAGLGGTALVHGSPKQRELDPADPAGGRQRAAEAFAHAAKAAEKHGVTYCIEPLSTAETEFITSVGEAAEIVTVVGSPHLKTMLDARAARLSESEDAAVVLERGLRDGLVAHVHLNDSSGVAPGQGNDEFASLLRVLKDTGYDGVVAVEPFTYVPDGPAAAAYAAGYLAGVSTSL